MYFMEVHEFQCHFVREDQTDSQAWRNKEDPSKAPGQSTSLG